MKQNGIIKLARMNDGKEVEFIIPITEASFRIQDNFKGIVTWNKETFDVNLENEKNKEAWDRWITTKEELSLKILKSHEIQKYVQESVDANVVTLRNELDARTEAMRRDFDERSEKIRLESDSRHEAIRKEYTIAQTEMLSTIGTLLTTLNEVVDSVKKDTATIKRNAVDMAEINKDFKEIQKTFKEILETE